MTPLFPFQVVPIYLSVFPRIKKNLLFISQLTTTYPCICEFSDDGFGIKDKMTGMILTKGTRMGDEYSLPRMISANFST